MTKPFRAKAGVIPYYINADGEVKMIFYISSDPEYGGPLPQIAKGEIDPGEDAKTAAIREGTEEVGLVPANIIAFRPVTTFNGVNKSERFSTQFFVARIKDPKNFVKPGFEAKGTLWLTPEEFAVQGRRDQLQIVRKALFVINQTLS